MSRPINRNLSSGDGIVFSRTGGYYKSVVTTTGIGENVIDGLGSEDEFVWTCRERSVFSDEDLKRHWNYNRWNRPFIVSFLYAHHYLQSVLRVLRKTNDHLHPKFHDDQTNGRWYYTD
jgi:hypothetical protein